LEKVGGGPARREERRKERGGKRSSPDLFLIMHRKQAIGQSTASNVSVRKKRGGGSPHSSIPLSILSWFGDEKVVAEGSCLRATVREKREEEGKKRVGLDSILL